LKQKARGVSKKNTCDAGVECTGRHLTLAIKDTITGSSTNTDVVVIPGRMTSQLPVLDIVVNKPIRDHLRQL
jgi:hypothetical protein